MNQCCLEIKNLDKSLGKNVAISSLNLSILKGKKIALLGLNGAGKSSFIRLLVGESKPDSGDIIYHTDRPNHTLNLHPQDLLFKKSLGYQADTMLAMTEMSGRKYLSLCGLYKGLDSKRIKSKITSLSQQWAIENLLEQPMSSLSKGNLQKLAIAQVFIAEPKWLFFDEPCQSLDPLEQDRFNQNIKGLVNFELCVFSTHNVSHAIEVADEIILFHQSKVAYHFESDKHNDYLLVCKGENARLGSLASDLELSINQIYPQVYQIQCSKSEPLQQLQNDLQQAGVLVEFCLPEAKAIMPLFRLLASGEINLSVANTASNTDLAEGERQ